MNLSLETEILYQLSLGIGVSMELVPMLRHTLGLLLRHLNGTSCVVLREQPGSRGDRFEAANCLPRRVGDNPAQQLCDEHPELLFVLCAGDGRQPLLWRSGEVTFYVYRLQDFGALVFGKRGPVLSPSLQRSFVDLADKLARAARACIAESRLRLAASVFANSEEGIVISDASNRIIDCNAAFTHITGFVSSEVLGRDPGMLSSGMQDAEFYATLWRDLHDHDSWRGEIWNRRKNGEIYAEMLAIAVLRDDVGQVRNYIGVFSDIDHVKKHEAELYQVSYYDPLTGLPNRRLLDDRLRQAMAQTHRSGHALAVCLLDLDGFKTINDRFGHKVGDLVLATVARRLRERLREGDTLARLGGDEFVLVLLDLASAGACDEAMRAVLDAVAQPIGADGQGCRVSGSIGVTFYPGDDADADTLIRHADQAMCLAKQSGKNRYHLFDTEQDRQVQAHREVRLRFAQALATDELRLFYQPKVNLRDGKVFGVEALLRWQHPQLGLLLPNEFLPAIAGTEFEILVGRWVIATALAQLAAWQTAGLSLSISVNVSASHLQQGDFAARLRAALDVQPTVAAACLELEILETAAITRFDEVAATLRACAQFGIRVALDDFGTGYSSLIYFQRLPVHVLKIDRGFVADMLDDEGDRHIVETVVRLARAFDRDVIAEGVESIDHARALLQLGCELAQGFGIARPMPAERLPEWIDGWYLHAAWRQLSD
jgi:diguanylate cyclase (GGDEF)-like protein/PAS domain S-box-containing protein